MTTPRAPAALTLIVCLALAGCSEPEAVPATPLPLLPSADSNARIAPLRGSVTAAGVAATYDAVFAQSQLQSIRERRASDPGSQSVYEFHGARLLRYAGAPLTSPGESVVLTFDTEGALLSARQGNAQVAELEVQEIRTRAQLLRSHALAQHAIHAHQTP